MSKPFDLWGQRGWAHLDIVGESRYPESFRALFGGRPGGGGAEMTTVVRLLPEPSNPFDPRAVAVWSGRHQLGYLARGDAVRYEAVLSSLVSQGWTPQVAARIWAGPSYRDQDGVTGSVRLDLGEPHQLVPANPAPGSPYHPLPPGAAIPVDASPAALLPWLRPEGECWAQATLHETADGLLEVRLDDAPIGRLTPQASAELLPAVRHLRSQGMHTVARTLVKGNRTRAEVVLHAQRARELPESWLLSVAATAPSATALPSPAETMIVPPVIAPPAVPEVRDPALPRPVSDDLPVRPIAQNPPASPAAQKTPAVQKTPATQKPPAVQEPPAVPVAQDRLPVRFISPPAQQHAPIPPPPSGVRFAPPPQWPQPPQGWTPPPGWRPDPAWPPAPANWQWWVPTWD